MYRQMDTHTEREKREAHSGTYIDRKNKMILRCTPIEVQVKMDRDTHTASPSETSEQKER